MAILFYDEKKTAFAVFTIQKKHSRRCDKNELDERGRILDVG